MNAKLSAKSKQPLELKSGNVRVKIYQGENCVGGKSYEQFTLVFKEGGRRIRKRFAILDAAKQEANFVLVKLENRHNEVLKLEPADRAIYVQALELIKPFNLPLNLAVAEYADARKELPAHVALKDAVADYLARHRQVREKKTVSELVEEYITAK